MGRPAKHFRDSTGKEIHGLALRSDGRFYAIRARNKTFGKDPIQAIRKFRQWEAKQGKLTAQLVDSEPWDLPEDAGPRLREWKDNLPNGNDIIHSLPTDMLWEYFAAQLHERPQWVADRTGIEQIGYLSELKPPPPSLKVEKIAELYGDKINCGDKEKRRSLSAWNEFIKIMRKQDSIKTLADIQSWHVEAYHSWVHSQFGTVWTAKTIKRRFGNIRGQLRYALKRCADRDQVRRVLDLTAFFEAPKDHNGTNPQPISVDDFSKLLEASRQTPTVDGDLWYCLLLMSLNFCFYPIDLAGLKPEHIDLKNGTMVYRRKKTGVMRVGVFWARTLKALKTYQAKHPHALDTIFGNYNRGKYSSLA